MKVVRIESKVTSKEPFQWTLFDLHEVECVVQTGAEIEIGMKSGRIFIFREGKNSEKQLEKLVEVLYFHLNQQLWAREKDIIDIPLDLEELPEKEKPHTTRGEPV